MHSGDCYWLVSIPSSSGISFLEIFIVLSHMQPRYVSKQQLYERNWLISNQNMELFFCLYANSWENPVQCNSSHSRLLGFFTAMPAVWRLLQCLRRYKDTNNIFPHLVNGGKYTATILAAVMLSFYRFNNTHTNLGLFIAISSINSIYCCQYHIFLYPQTLLT